MGNKIIFLNISNKNVNNMLQILILKKFRALPHSPAARAQTLGFIPDPFLSESE